MTYIDFDKLVAMMIKISPRANHAFHSESYLFSMENMDDVNSEAVFVYCFRYLLDDLGDIGVESLVELESMFVDGFTMEKVLDALSLVLPNNLISILTYDSKLLNIMESILDGSSGINDNTLHAWLRYVAEEDPILSKVYGEGALKLLEFITCTESFDTYIKNIIENINSQGKLVEGDFDEFMPNVITSHYNAFLKSQEIVSSILNVPDMTSHFRKHVKVITDPSNISSYSWLLCNKDFSAVGADTLRKNLSIQLSASSPLYTPYYKLRDITITIDHISLLLTPLLVDIAVDDSLSELISRNLISLIHDKDGSEIQKFLVLVNSHIERGPIND